MTMAHSPPAQPGADASAPPLFAMAESYRDRGLHIAQPDQTEMPA